MLIIAECTQLFSQTPLHHYSDSHIYGLSGLLEKGIHIQQTLPYFSWDILQL